MQKLLFAVAIFLGVTCYAGTKLPIDAATGSVAFKQTFKIQPGFTANDAYALIEDWFNANPSRFTTINGDIPNVNCKNKALVEEAFDNRRPLQSLDPASGRIAGRGLIKYFGGANSNISLLYMEYYIVVEVSGQYVTATVSGMKYHHFNARTYNLKPIFEWQGGKPYDPADKLENLVNNPGAGRETQLVGTTVKDDIKGLFCDLKLYLQNKNAIVPAAYQADAGTTN